MQIKIGRVTHYYNRIGVAVLELTEELNIGETILFLGHSTDFTQTVTSMEIDHQKVQSVSPDMDMAVKVIEPVRRGDTVYKIVETEAPEAGAETT